VPQDHGPQQTVRQLVPPTLGDPADVRGVEGGQRLLAGDRAPALVGVGQDQLEGALAEPGRDPGNGRG